MGTANANSTNGITVTITGVNTNTALISVNWGDGQNWQEQALSFSHVYAEGTYTADLLVVDTNAVNSYDMTITVSLSPATPVNVSVMPFPSTAITNQSIVPAQQVSGFAVVQMTSISISNGYPVVGLFGVPTWSYTIRASSNLLQQFIPIGSAVAGSNGVFQFQDPTANTNAMRFYRASYP